MPINESTRKTRERWPLQFDLEGIPRDTATRKQRLQQLEFQEQPEMPRTQNVFSVDASQKTENVIDLSQGGAASTARYGTPANPRQDYPKMVYDHESGRVLIVHNKPQHTAAAKRGFKDEPSPTHDYSKVRSGSIAPIKEVGPEREKLVTAEELEQAEAEELAALEDETNTQSDEDAEREIAAQLGEPLSHEGEDSAPRRRGKR